MSYLRLLDEALRRGHTEKLAVSRFDPLEHLRETAATGGSLRKTDLGTRLDGERVLAGGVFQHVWAVDVSCFHG